MHSRNSAAIRATQMFCFPQARGNIINYPVRMLMRPGYPHSARINDMIRRAFEAGLIQKWSGDNEVRRTTTSSSAQSATPCTVDSVETRVTDSNGDNVVLTLEHLAGGWTLLLFGLPFGILTLAAELLTARRVRMEELGDAAAAGRWHRWILWAERIFLQPRRSFFNRKRHADLAYLE